MNTTHDPAFEELTAWLDGELTPAEAERVRAHVASCASCQRLRQDMQEVSRRMAAWSVPEAPASLRPPGGRTLSWTSARWLPVAAGLVLTAGVLLVWLAERREVNPPMAVTLGGAEGAAKATRAAAALAERSVVREQAALVSEAPLLVRTARLALVPRDFDAARAGVERLVASAGGFVGRIELSDPRGGARTLNATLRIPAGKLDEVLTRLKQLGQVTAESQDGEDVTRQSVDLHARLANARASEQRLRDILTNRTGRLADVLDVEREISRVRGEIERMEAERQSLDRRVTFAELTLEIAEERTAAVDLGPLPVATRLRNALVDGCTSAINRTLDVAVVLAHVGPTLALWGLVVGPPVWFIRRRYAR
jgi:predicted anti-sigma-YlaC factor YlaD